MYTQDLVLYDELVMFLGHDYNRKVTYFFLRKAFIWKRKTTVNFLDHLTYCSSL